MQKKNHIFNSLLLLRSTATWSTWIINAIFSTVRFNADPLHESSSSPHWTLFFYIPSFKACKVREKLFTVHWIVIIFSCLPGFCKDYYALFLFLHGIINNYRPRGRKLHDSNFYVFMSLMLLPGEGRGRMR